MAERKLDIKRARTQTTKNVWLLRESSVTGLLTASYFSQEKQIYLHQRIGFIDGWQFAPADKKQAEQFAKRASLAFKDNLPENSADSLLTLLVSSEFELCNLVHPNAIEATREPQFSGYKDFDDTPSHSYTPWG